MGIRILVQTERTHRGTRLGTTYRPLDIEQRTRLGLALLLRGDDLAHLLHMVAQTQLACRVEILYHHIVMHGHIARGLVCHMHVVSLLHKADKGSAHRDHIVVGVRREDNHTLRERRRRHGTRRVVSIGFASRPAGNRMLQVVEDLDIDCVVRDTDGIEQRSQRVFDIVLYM